MFPVGEFRSSNNQLQGDVYIPKGIISADLKGNPNIEVITVFIEDVSGIDHPFIVILLKNYLANIPIEIISIGQFLEIVNIIQRSFY